MRTVYTTHPSPLGELLLTGDGHALASVTVPGQRGRGVVQPLPEWTHDQRAFAAAREQLDAYFAGDLTAFQLELHAPAPEFTRRVWEALDALDYGETVSYRDLATRAGATPGAVRAVGGAVGANPLLIVRPCHRVIGASGALTGYAGGLDRKRRLLELEGVPC
ncbi:methylated-DNA--[protein]-cysteine S-methyltransferase [Streptomyces sp. AJS327]|uniref:methylated-DNA--[protein]-cysteine S-methyltransferase n=1 Tax=Streptomyces sp. AJS327 TaxID=2545265 RepID=UPI0015DF0F12|nr:methylated-DNA--[protein]-cysteine S-methyltransferase [Streptomyces sp. AJS327]MBA0052096.1 methylated-DNA--[protein]-cysteine S-methyltransferase [Streptomyces sp. AJS327]